tara:strand:+ start:1093 stop:1644 length:552 start_codon:yes stop_codon:yes gene_type:complete
MNKIYLKKYLIYKKKYLNLKYKIAGNILNHCDEECLKIYNYIKIKFDETLTKNIKNSDSIIKNNVKDYKIKLQEFTDTLFTENSYVIEKGKKITEEVLRLSKNIADNEKNDFIKDKLIIIKKGIKRIIKYNMKMYDIRMCNNINQENQLSENESIRLINSKFDKYIVDKIVESLPVPEDLRLD